MSFTTFEGTVWQSEKSSCLSTQSICHLRQDSSNDEVHSSVFASVVQDAMWVAMDEALQTNEVRRTRGWKLFLLLPGCCYTGQDEVATFQQASWCNGLTIFMQVSGPKR